MAKIVVILNEEGIETCRQTVWCLKQHINAYGYIQPLPKSGRPTVLTSEVLKMIDDAMQQDDETTAKQLSSKLHGKGISMSTSTILKGRHLLGWTSRGAAYCQLIRIQNQLKRVEWAKQNLGASFKDVI